MLNNEDTNISENSQISLRKATLADMAFIRDLFYSEMDEIVNEAWQGRFRWEGWFNDVQKALELESHIVQLIQFTNQNIGFLWMNKEDRNLWITAIVLKKEWQRRNIGSKIMTHLVGECRSDGINTIELGVQKNNNAALRFYSEIGFERFDQVRSARTDLLRLKLINLED